MSLEPGQRIAERYRLERLIGRGGMGEVWAATHVVTEQRVAMKFVDTSLRVTPQLRERLFREAKAAGRVDHPSVIKVIDAFAVDDDVPVIVMELLEGETLASKLLRDGPLPLEAAANVMSQAVSAVGAAHACGIIHRDLKPDNLFLCDGDEPPRVKVLDFGVAKLASPDEQHSGLTSMGQLLGTPAYMAPEQCRGDRGLDHRVDMWAIGVMLYETVSGERPIEGDTVGEVVEYLLTEGVPPLRELAPEAPFDFAVAARRLLERDPHARGDDLREVAAVLEGHATIEVPSFGAAEIHTEEAGDDKPRSQRRMSVTRALKPTQSRTLEPSQTDVPRESSGRRWLIGVAIAAVVGVLAWRSLSANEQSGDETLAAETAPASTAGETLDAPAPSTRAAAKPEPSPAASATGSASAARAQPPAPPARAPKPAPALPRPAAPKPTATAEAAAPTSTATKSGIKVQTWD